MLDLEKIGKKNICFMGLMGSGKTIIGKSMANICNLSFFDSDLEIENRYNLKINNIFEEYGEEYFREIEEKICMELLDYNNCVISLGGGSILSRKVREKVIKISYSIYLNTEISKLVKRLKNTDKRPLLKNVNIEKKLIEILHLRKKYYGKANLIIENDFDQKSVINKILQKLKKND